MDAYVSAWNTRARLYAPNLLTSSAGEFRCLCFSSCPQYCITRLTMKLAGISQSSKSLVYPCISRGRAALATLLVCDTQVRQAKFKICWVYTCTATLITRNKFLQSPIRSLSKGFTWDFQNESQVGKQTHPTCQVLARLQIPASRFFIGHFYREKQANRSANIPHF